MRYYEDMVYFLIYHDPYIPRIYDDARATSQDIESLLRDIQLRQSPGVRYYHFPLQNFKSGKYQDYSLYFNKNASVEIYTN